MVRNLVLLSIELHLVIISNVKANIPVVFLLYRFCITSCASMRRSGLFERTEINLVVASSIISADIIPHELEVINVQVTRTAEWLFWSFMKKLNSFCNLSAMRICLRRALCVFLFICLLNLAYQRSTSNLHDSHTMSSVHLSNLSEYRIIVLYSDIRIFR